MSKGNSIASGTKGDFGFTPTGNWLGWIVVFSAKTCG
jgi:hypothetical protein